MNNVLPNILIITIYRNPDEGFIASHRSSDNQSFPLQLFSDNLFKIREPAPFQLRNGVAKEYDIIPIPTKDGIPTYRLKNKQQTVVIGGGGGKKGDKGDDGDSCFEEGSGFEACQQHNTVLPNDASGDHSFASGSGTISSGENSHSEGALTEAVGIGSHAEGVNSKANGLASHVEGGFNEANGIASHAEGAFNITNGDFSHAEGQLNIANGDYSHAEGIANQANGNFSHAEGNGTFANGIYSHVEGKESIADGDASHAEGASHAVGAGSHSEGNNTTATGDRSHSQGENTESLGFASQAGGSQSIAEYHSSIARASGFFRTLGDAQYHIITERIETDNTVNPAVPQELFIDGNTGTLRVTIADNSSWKFVINLIAVDIATGDTLSREFQGAIKRVGGVTTISVNIIPAGTFVIQSSQDVGLPTADAIIDTVLSTANNALVVSVTGEAGKVIDWMAQVMITQIKY